MAIDWMDGFELATVGAIRARYDSSSGPTALVAGRTGTYAANMGNGQMTKYLTGIDARTVGIALFAASWSDVDFIVLMDSADTVHLTVRTNADGTFSVYRGSSTTGTMLGTSAAVTAGFWIYVEFKALIHDTAGYFDLHINEVSQVSLTGVDTRNAGTAQIARIQINGRTTGGGTSNYYVDDYYVGNLSNPVSAGGFSGNTRVEMLLPSGPGLITGWTPFTDSNYKNVDENPHNSDTDYNYSATTNASDLYAMGNMSNATGTPRAVQVTYVARKDDALQRVTAPLVRTGGIIYAGTDDSLTTSYAYYEEVWNFSPNTSTIWTISEVNALEAGIQVRG